MKCQNSKCGKEFEPKKKNYGLKTTFCSVECSKKKYRNEFHEFGQKVNKLKHLKKLGSLTSK